MLYLMLRELLTGKEKDSTNFTMVQLLTFATPNSKGWWDLVAMNWEN